MELVLNICIPLIYLLQPSLIPWMTMLPEDEWRRLFKRMLRVLSFPVLLWVFEYVIMPLYQIKSFSLQEGAPEILPHVYTSSSVVQGNLLSHLGTKYVLPIGTTREFHHV